MQQPLGTRKVGTQERGCMRETAKVTQQERDGAKIRGSVQQPASAMG